MQYDFLAPRQIAFGWGRRREVGSLGRTLGTRAFLICGLPIDLAETVMGEISDLLQAEDVDPSPLATIDHEPEISDVDHTAALIRERDPCEGDFLLAVGGGAAIDLAKAVAAMALNKESPTVKDYLEGVGRGLTLTEAPLPILAMPTTAGTGAEATKNAVISSYDPPFKKSLRDNRMMPQIALVDPELCVTAPPNVTAAGGMDAITQLIESCISRKSQPIPQAFALQGLRLAVPAIVHAVEDGTSRRAREAMSHAALLSGMALANSGLGLAHGVAPALGTHCRVPHGVACALMLPTALRVNAKAREAELAGLAAYLFGSEETSCQTSAVGLLIERIEALCDRVGVPRRLSQVGVKPEQIPAIVKDSRGSSMSGNPVELSDDELTRLLEELL
ncbi:MAG: iron-containing alcohol dehydrogenase [Candidatus Nealsonbacteria bacterium]|nr:iron-containing alcohol dehydrogenase [Candidatus Nealsonbacteria bacterium]